VRKQAERFLRVLLVDVVCLTVSLVRVGLVLLTHNPQIA